MHELLHEARRSLPLIAAPWAVLLARAAFSWFGGRPDYPQRASFAAPRDRTIRTLSDVVLELGGQIGRSEPSAGLLWFTAPLSRYVEIRFAATVIERTSGSSELALDGHPVAHSVGAFINPSSRRRPDPGAAIISRMLQALPADAPGPVPAG